MRGGPSPLVRSRGSGRLSLVLFLVLVVGGGLVIGFAARPGEWYAGLAKPAFNPPNWLFPPVWTTLYVVIAVAGWRVWRKARARLTMKLWWAQLALNFAWSPTFFGAHQMAVGLAIIVALLATIVAFIISARRVDRPAALLFAPYAAWVAFATALNGALLALN